MFRDLGKNIKELLEDDYIYVQNIKFKARNSSNIVINGDTEFGANKPPYATISASRIGPFFSLDKLRIKSDGRFLLDVSLKTSELSKVIVSTEDGRQIPGKPLQNYGKIGFELNHPIVGAHLDVDVVNGPLINTSALYKYRNCSAGFESIINTHLDDKDQSPDLTDLNIGISYRGNDWAIVGKTFESFSSLRFSYIHQLSTKTTISTQIDYHLKNPSQKILVGTKHLLNDTTTIKTKIDSNAILSGSFKHQLSGNVSLLISGEFNAHNWSNDTHRFGLGLSFD